VPPEWAEGNTGRPAHRQITEVISCFPDYWLLTTDSRFCAYLPGKRI